MSVEGDTKNIKIILLPVETQKPFISIYYISPYVSFLDKNVHQSG